MLKFSTKILLYNASGGFEHRVYQENVLHASCNLQVLD